MNTDDTHMRELQAAFKFTDNDLAANREHKLTPAQQVLVGNRATGLVIRGAILWAILIAYCTLISTSESINPEARTVLMMIFAVIALLLCVQTIAWLHQIEQVSPNAQDADLAVAEGVAALSRVTVRSATYYYLTIGSIRFAIGKQHFRSLHDRRRYRVYYIAPLKLIVAIEPL